MEVIKYPSRKDWGHITARPHFDHAALQGKVQIVGDDLFVTNTRRLKQGIAEHCANSILIKLNSISYEYIELLLPLITSKLSMDESVRLETVQCLNSIFSTKGHDFLSQFVMSRFLTL